MKYFIRLAIALASFSSTVVGQEADNNEELKSQLNETKAAHNEQVKAQLYERMAADSFTFFAEIQSGLPDKDKKRWFRNGAVSAFRYWLTTRKGKIPTSTSVDSAIAMLYEEAVKSEMSAVFSDPLLRLNSKDPERIGISGFPTISQNDYVGYTKEFKEFLYDILKQRENRFKR